MAAAYSFGIEEEYFLVDADTKFVCRSMPDGFLKEAKEALQGRVTGEFLQSQIEVVTQPLTDIAEARALLRSLRKQLAAIAAKYKLAIMASGTHPTAVWERAQQSEGARYDAVMDDLQMIGRRNMLCGLHVHVELPDPGQRIDVMMRMLPYLPLFIALSTSSPFWRSQPTGLKGYRLAAYDELPRTGIPELFRTQADFDSYIDALVRAGVMPDSSYIWWAVRPSRGHPTLELRAPDSCTDVDDVIAIAALYRTLARWLVRHPERHWTMNAVTRAIIVENKWRAQRYGVEGTFVKIEGDGPVSVARMLDRIVADITPDARDLGCLDEVLRCLSIVSNGSSADRQIAAFRPHEDNPVAGLRAAVDWIAKATLQ
jgi:carboxylate-amine ligase